MAYGVLLYDRFENEASSAQYMEQSQALLKKVLSMPGVVSFMGYRAVSGSPNTISITEFRTIEDVRRAAESDELRAVFEAMEASGTRPMLLIMERSPLTPEPILAPQA
jgi:heme-degrading monooxygenase HmoA